MSEKGKVFLLEKDGDDLIFCVTTTNKGITIGTIDRQTHVQSEPIIIPRDRVDEFLHLLHQVAGYE